MDIIWNSSQGWQCPVCQHVYGPYVAECFRCPQNTITGSSIEGYHRAVQQTLENIGNHPPVGVPPSDLT